MSAVPRLPRNYTHHPRSTTKAGYQANLEALSSHLDEGESVLISCDGAYDTKSLASKTVKNGVLLATAKRVIQFGKRLFGFNQETFPLQNITTIEVSKGFMGKRIVIKMSGTSLRLSGLPRATRMASLLW
jgi:hypothetical protein